MGALAVSADQQARLAHALGGVMRELYGRGPRRTRVYFADEHLFVVFDGGLTALEETLIEGGAGKLVQQVRDTFDDLEGADRLRETVEGVLGVPVLDLQSRVMGRSERVVKVFVLDHSRFRTDSR